MYLLRNDEEAEAAFLPVRRKALRFRRAHLPCRSHSVIRPVRKERRALRLPPAVWERRLPSVRMRPCRLETWLLRRRASRNRDVSADEDDSLGDQAEP